MLVSNPEESLLGPWKAGKVEPKQELVHQLQSLECKLEFYLDLWPCVLSGSSASYGRISSLS